MSLARLGYLAGALISLTFAVVTAFLIPDAHPEDAPAAWLQLALGATLACLCLWGFTRDGHSTRPPPPST